MSSPSFAVACALENVKTARKWQSCHPHFSGRNFEHKAPPWRRLESSQSPGTLCLVHATHAVSNLPPYYYLGQKGGERGSGGGEEGKQHEL